MNEEEKRKDLQIIDKLAACQLDYINDYALILKQITPSSMEHIFNACKTNYQNSFLKEELHNRELLILYNTFIIKVLELIDFLHFPHNDLEYALIVEHLIHKGYLSFNNCFRITNCDDYLHYHLGIQVITGKAVCRHIANFYNDLNLSSFYPSIFTGNLSPSDITNDKPNHIINIINYHDTLYGIDLTNTQLFYFLNEKVLKSLKNPKMTMTYKSFNDVFKSPLSIKEICSNLEMYRKGQIKEKMLSLK